MERNYEREKYYEETNYRTDVGKDWFKHMWGVKYNYVHDNI